jgi:hypothetical protein
MSHAVPPICLKMARVAMAERLASDDRFVVMGDNADKTGMIVYTRSLIPGLPPAYKGWRVEQVSIYAVRHSVEEHEAYERRIRQG